MRFEFGKRQRPEQQQQQKNWEENKRKNLKKTYLERSHRRR